MEWKGVNLNQRNFEFEYSDFNKAHFQNRWLRRFEIKAKLLLDKKVPGKCDFNELVHRYKKVFNAQLIVG
ncbi:unnamed protein product [marine sediment metagenome]|uniref:Uncharacterized protein n=1 Tax=marine sediment metagenome TaxID=412755 RepID=X0V244_9ZZZZ